ncbi:MAG: hypothetical protein JRN62_02645 [Nitrososphaerota archaeon]|nr:hypothetical protein [Nitrososphaerota archaeon]
MKYMILFVCNGNVWRSQLAEYYFNKLFKNKESASAGLSDRWMGKTVKDVLSILHDTKPLLPWLHATGIHIEDNQCKTVTKDMVDGSAIIFVFDSVLLDEMKKRFPEASDRVVMLGKFAGLAQPEIPNTLNMGMNAHIAAAEKVRSAMETIERRGLIARYLRT